MRVTRGAAHVNNVRLTSAARQSAQVIKSTGNVGAALPQYLKILAEGLADPQATPVKDGEGRLGERGPRGTPNVWLGGMGKKFEASQREWSRSCNFVGEDDTQGSFKSLRNRKEQKRKLV